jgi:hypothetical protein
MKLVVALVKPFGRFVFAPVRVIRTHCKKECSFLKKRTKKLLLRCRGLTSAAHKIQKFFASFFQKRSSFFLLLPRACAWWAASSPPMC